MNNMDRASLWITPLAQNFEEEIRKALNNDWFLDLNGLLKLGK